MRRRGGLQDVGVHPSRQRLARPRAACPRICAGGCPGHARGERSQSHLVLDGPHVVDAIISNSWLIQRAPQFRMPAALDAGWNARGQVGSEGHLPERSAASRVVAHPDYPEADIRVKLHQHVVAKLLRVLEQFKRYETLYRDRGNSPRTAISQDAFVAQPEGRRSNAKKGASP